MAQVGEQRLAAEVHGHLVEINHPVAHLRGRRNDQVHVGLGGRRGVGVGFEEAVETRLGFAGLCLGPAADPLELLAQEHLALVFDEFLGGQLLGARDEVVGVVALVAFEDAIAQLHDAVHDLVEEVAVVGDHQQAAGVAGEEGGDPLDGVGVEMVGGLVQHQDVRLRHERTGERDTALLATGELADLSVVGRAGELVERGPDAGVEIPAVLMDDLLLEFLVAPGVSGEGFVLVDEIQDMASALAHGVVHRLVGGEFKGLGQVAHDGAALARDQSVVGLQLPGEDAEEGGLAGAIAADESHPISGSQAKGGVVEENAFVVLQDEVLGGQDGSFGTHRAADRT